MATRDPKCLLWQETSPGHWERGLDEAELFYSSLAKRWEGMARIFFAMTGCVEVFVDLSMDDDFHQIESRVETALGKAWRRLRYDHPTLASTVEYDASSQVCKKVYETFLNDKSGERELEWLNKSFLIVKNGQSGTEFCNSDPPVQRYATLHIITPPEKNQDIDQKTLRKDVVFRSHHDVIDGIGTLMLINNLFRLAVQAYEQEDNYPNIKFGTEFQNLSPPFRIAASVPYEPTASQKEKAHLIIAANAAAKDTTIPTLGVPFNTTSKTPGINHRTAIHLSETETQAVLQKCKATHISATEAFHAGIVLALRDLPENASPRGPMKRRYINKCLINLRALCAPPYNTSQHAAAVYHSGSGRALVIDVTVPPVAGESQMDAEEQQLHRQEDFSAIVERVKAFYKTVREDPDHLAMVPLYYNAITPTYPDPKDPDTEIPPPSTNPSVSISSLGVLDRMIQARHGAFRLNEPWVAADEYSTGVGVFLATWEGRMCLSAGFNMAFHDEAGILEFLEGIKNVVLKGLQVI